MCTKHRKMLHKLNEEFDAVGKIYLSIKARKEAGMTQHTTNKQDLENKLQQYEKCEKLLTNTKNDVQTHERQQQEIAEQQTVELERTDQPDMSAQPLRGPFGQNQSEIPEHRAVDASSETTQTPFDASSETTLTPVDASSETTQAPVDASSETAQAPVDASSETAQTQGDDSDEQEDDSDDDRQTENAAHLLVHMQQHKQSDVDMTSSESDESDT